MTRTAQNTDGSGVRRRGRISEEEGAMSPRAHGPTRPRERPRAVRFQPGALRDDVVSPLYDPPRGGAGARDEPSGVELGDSKIA